jgi:hypothetical protein
LLHQVQALFRLDEERRENCFAIKVRQIHGSSSRRPR